MNRVERLQKAFKRAKKIREAFDSDPEAIPEYGLEITYIELCNAEKELAEAIAEEEKRMKENHYIETGVVDGRPVRYDTQEEGDAAKGLFPEERKPSIADKLLNDMAKVGECAAQAQKDANAKGKEREPTVCPFFRMALIMNKKTQAEIQANAVLGLCEQQRCEWYSLATGRCGFWTLISTIESLEGAIHDRKDDG